MKTEKRILLSMICLVCITILLTPVLSVPPYYHEEGNVNYPGAYFESVYNAKGIGVDDYITLVDLLIMLRALPSDQWNYLWGTNWSQYNPDTDITQDGFVDSVDLAMCGMHFGFNYHYSQFQTVLGDTTVTVNAPTNPIMPGEQFTVDVAIDWVEGLHAYEFALSWNPWLLEVVSVADGSFSFGLDGGPYPIIGTNYVYVGDALTTYPHLWVGGSGTLAQITFECKGGGTTILDLSSRLFDFSLYSMPHQDEDATVIQVDTIPPEANAGPDQTVDQGTLVTFDGSGSYDNAGIISYIWTFIDVTPQTLTGINPTYTFTTPGIYTVTLDVSDAAGYHATDTVTITVLGPEEHTQQLIQTIDSWSLPFGTKTTLTSKLQAVLDLLAQGNEVGAVHKLMDFIRQVEAFRGKKLTNQQADYLVAEAQRTINLLTG